MNDPRGNAAGTSSAEALAHAETALWRMVSFFDTPVADIDAAAAADPAWAWPHLMRGAFLLTLTEPPLHADAVAALDAAQARARTLTPREQAHLGAARRCADGDWAGASAAWGAIAEAHPRDLYALQWAHLFDLHRGDSNALRERPRRALGAWSSDDPLRPYLLGMLAFGLEESQHYDEAEAAGREAAEAAKVPWATHAVAHVMEMQGRTAEGVAWLREREADWAEGNGFSVHHWWHLGLFLLESMETDDALALYDTRLCSTQAPLTLQRLDGASLLWRLRLLDVDVGTRWHDAAIGWDFNPSQAGHSVFNDMHALLVLLGQRRHADAKAWIDAVQASAARASGGSPLHDIAPALMHGLLALDEGRFVQALRLLGPLRAQLHRIGGSHAQRDLVDQTLLAAAAGASDRGAVRALLDERHAYKSHTALTRHWMRRTGMD